MDANEQVVLDGFFNPKPAYMRTVHDLETCSECGKPVTGGRIVLTTPPRLVCKVCDNPPVRPTNTFPFTTSQFNGTPVEVESLRQLRSLEREFGVHCAPYADEERHLNDEHGYGRQQIKGVRAEGGPTYNPEERR